MAEHFNRLTPAQAERLAILAEEAGEVVQAVGKVLRHGYFSYHPDNHDTNNRDSLELELGDLTAIIHDMVERGDISIKPIERRRDDKLRRLKVGVLYLHHQREQE